MRSIKTSWIAVRVLPRRLPKLGPRNVNFGFVFFVVVSKGCFLVDKFWISNYFHDVLLGFSFIRVAFVQYYCVFSTRLELEHQVESVNWKFGFLFSHMVTESGGVWSTDEVRRRGVSFGLWPIQWWSLPETHNGNHKKKIVVLNGCRNVKDKQQEETFYRRKKDFSKIKGNYLGKVE